MSDGPARPEHEPAAPARRAGSGADEPTDAALARLLADPAVWVDARPSLEGESAEAVHARAAAELRARRAPRRRRRLSVLVTAAAAAMILAVVVAAAVLIHDKGPRQDFAAQLTGTERA